MKRHDRSVSKEVVSKEVPQVKKEAKKVYYSKEETLR